MPVAKRKSGKYTVIDISDGSMRGVELECGTIFDLFGERYMVLKQNSHNRCCKDCEMGDICTLENTAKCIPSCYGRIFIKIDKQ